MQKIFIAADHAGFHLKADLKTLFNLPQYDLIDLGTDTADSVDFADFAHQLSKKVLENDQNIGVLLCGSGIGISIAANRHRGIRAALCWNVAVTKLARQHNNANVLCLPARFMSAQEAVEVLDVFLKTPFEGGRHQRRIDKIELV